MTLIPKFQPDEPVCEKHHCRGFCQQCFADMVRHPLEQKIAELEKELAAKSPSAPTSTAIDQPKDQEVPEEDIYDAVAQFRKDHPVPEENELQPIASHVTTEQDWADRATEYYRKFNERGQTIATLTADLSDARKRIEEYQIFSKRAEREIQDLNRSVADLEKKIADLQPPHGMPSPDGITPRNILQELYWANARIRELEINGGEAHLRRVVELEGENAELKEQLELLIAEKYPPTQP
jgi:hypothetical protein